MSQAVCLFSVPTSFVVGEDVEDVSSEVLIFTPQVGQTLRMSRSVCLFWWPCSWAQILLRMPHEAPGAPRRPHEVT
eukprot:7227631-Pyramimonas_sp.AAC.2